ncbi:GntR family transcriptional regulator [Pseudoclavibacter sp. AY1F1]|uniref:GntR family transcriptional regulator n=1 Tax=Pseudoclavibacter sp. AY1F1 TaxID=2080583 RepID=UPI0011B094D7|nr:GntR family transcriptional regulator [Pseudoclavibacter sp. AY1F1]
MIPVVAIPETEKAVRNTYVPDALKTAVAREFSASKAEPMYSQLTQILASSIRAGILPSYTRLPSEAELSNQLHISPSIIKRSISCLVDEGLVVRVPGVGTRVLGSQFTREKHGARDELHCTLTTPISRISRAERLPVADDIATVLGDGESRETLLITTQLRAGNLTVALMRSYLPIDASIDLDLVAQHGVHRALEFSLLRPVSGTEECRVRASTNDEAAALGIPPGHWVLTLERTMHATNGSVVEIANHAYHPEHFLIRRSLT